MKKDSNSIFMEDLKNKITPDTSIQDILSLDRGIAAVLMANGMSCVGCASANEPLSTACHFHGADINQVISDITEYLEIVNEA